MRASSASPGRPSATSSLRTQKIEVGDGMLHLALAGEGSPLLLLHGWTLDGRMWRPQLPLAKGRMLVMPDRRGFGASSAPPALDREHEDVERIADWLGVERLAVVGLSQGATVALDHARRNPERVAALALIGAPLHGLVPDPEGSEHIPLDHYAALVRAGRLDEMKQLWRAHPLMRARAQVGALVDEILVDYEGRDLKLAGAPVRFAEQDIAGLGMPVLAATGAADTGWRRAVADRIAVTAPHAMRASVAGAGHLCNADAPADFNMLLADFLAHAGM